MNNTTTEENKKFVIRFKDMETHFFKEKDGEGDIKTFNTFEDADNFKKTLDFNLKTFDSREFKRWVEVF